MNPTDDLRLEIEGFLIDQLASAIGYGRLREIAEGVGGPGDDHHDRLVVADQNGNQFEVEVEVHVTLLDDAELQRRREIAAGQTEPRA